MVRYDLRKYKDDFYDRMMQLIDENVKENEIVIFMFEIGDFTPIQKSADIIKEAGHELMNSLKFNEVDWTIVVKKMPPKPKLEADEDTETDEESKQKESKEKIDKTEANKAEVDKKEEK